MHFIEVSRERFFQVMGPLNVHPIIVSDWHDVTGYTTDWKDQLTGKVIGQIDGRAHLHNERYKVLKELA